MAALSDSTFSFTGIFQKTSVPKSFLANDDTDWAVLIAQGYTPGGIYLKLTFTSSSGTTVMYDNLDGAVTGNTYDITYPATQNTNVIPLPLQTNGNAAFGVYTLYMQYQYLDSNGADFSNTITSTYEYQWIAPTVQIGYRVNIPGSTITTIDNTNYGNDIVASSRVHTINPPGNAMLPPLSLPIQQTSLATNVYVNITTGTWSAKVVTDITYALQTGQYGWQAIEKLIGCIEFFVMSNIDLNALLCCLGNFKTQYEEALLNNHIQAEELKRRYIDPIERNLIFYYAYILAGCEDKAAEIIEILRDISGCNCECGGDECPTIIPAIVGQSFLYNVDSPLQTITVTSSTVGDTTTFHIDVSQTIIDVLANIKTYIVTGTSPITVTPTTSPDGKTITYNVSLDRPMGLLQNKATVQALIEYNSFTPGWQISIYDILTDTGGFVVDDFANHQINFPYGNADTNAVAFKYSNFFTSNQSFVALAQVNCPETYNKTIITAESIVKNLNVMEANILWKENDANMQGNAILVRLYNPVNGTPVMFDDLNREEKIQVRLDVLAES